MNVKEQFAHQGGNVVIHVYETGQQLNLNFKPGEKTKRIRVTLGSREFVADLVLEEILNPKDGAHNMGLAIDFPKLQTTAYEAAADASKVTEPPADPEVNVEVVAEPEATKPDEPVVQADAAPEVSPEDATEAPAEPAPAPASNDAAQPASAPSGNDRKNRRR